LVLKVEKCPKNNKKTLKILSQKTYLTFWLVLSVKQTWSTLKTKKGFYAQNAARSIQLKEGFPSCSLAR